MASATRPHATRWRTWTAFALALTLLAWFAVVVALRLSDGGLPRTTASRFVPADGYRHPAVFGQDGKRAEAMVEDARLRGTALRWAVSPSLFKATAPPPGFQGARVDGLLWWRESVIAPGGEPRYRVFSVTDDGVRMHGQDWGQRGLTLIPAPVWLPADVHAGARWTGSGTAAGGGRTGLLDYRMTAAATSVHSRGGGAGCLEVTYTTDLTPKKDGGSAPVTRWTERDEWCPGRGVVASSGSLGDATYSISTATGRSAVPAPDNARPRTPDTSDLGGWRAARLKAEEGDDTFGSVAMQAFPEHPPVVTTLGCVVFASAATTDLVGLIPLETGGYWLHWWARPGGRILSTAAFGRTVVVTTSERMTSAYAPGGRVLWSVHLDDVALGAPVRVSRDRLAVASVRGTVSVRSAVDGRLVWSRRVPDGVANPLASDGKVVAAVDDQRNLHVFDAHTGRQRWTAQVGPNAGVVGVGGGRTLVAGNEIRAYDDDTGALVWHHSGVTWGGGLEVAGDEVGVDTGEGVRLYALSDGSALGLVRGANDPQPVGGTWFVLEGRSLVAVDRTGATLRSWPLSVRARNREIAVGPTGVWVFGYTPGDVPLAGERVSPA